MANEPQPQTTYTIRVYRYYRWATGDIRSTGVQVVEVVEDSTILGGARAIDRACEIVGVDNVAADIHSPEITPNPAVLGWPLGNVEVGK